MYNITNKAEIIHCRVGSDESTLARVSSVGLVELCSTIIVGWKPRSIWLLITENTLVTCSMWYG